MKTWVHSRTIWLGILTALSSLAASPDIIGLLPDNLENVIVQGILLVVGVLTIVLRVDTDTPISARKTVEDTPQKDLSKRIEATVKDKAGIALDRIVDNSMDILLEKIKKF